MKKRHRYESGEDLWKWAEEAALAKQSTAATEASGDFVSPRGITPKKWFGFLPGRTSRIAEERSAPV